MTLSVDRIKWGAILLIIGTIGGWCAAQLGLPIPYMIGSMIFAGALCQSAHFNKQTWSLPEPLRRAGIAVVGSLIGATFSPALLALIPSLWVSFLAMILFVLIAHRLGVFIMQKVGRYDLVTAQYAGIPGGLIEAIQMAEERGGDVRAVTLVHFSRVVLIILVVPLIFWLIMGQAVGSAAGQTFQRGAWGVLDLIEIAGLSFFGLILGKRLRLPAGHMVGPLLLCGAAHAFDLLHVNSPVWLLAIAQVVIGTSLGTRFGGLKWQEFSRALLSSAIFLAGSLTLALIMAELLHLIIDQSVAAIFLSFAPGGVIEMGLIALSLGLSPLFVAAHHIFRIIFAVFYGSRVGSRQ